MWITYFFKEFIVIWQANIFLPFKTACRCMFLNLFSGYAIFPSLTVYERKNGYTLDFMRSVAIFPFVTICAIFSLIPVLTVLFL